MHSFNQPYGGDRYMSQYMPIQQPNANIASSHPYNPMAMGAGEGYYYQTQPNIHGQTQQQQLHQHPHQLQQQLQQQQHQFSATGGLSSFKHQSPVDDMVFTLVQDILEPDTRSAALAELSRRRDEIDNLALILWHSFGIMAILIQELLAIYPQLYATNLNEDDSIQVCNVLALIQVIASHPQTRMHFITAHIPIFLFPFLETKAETKPFEHLRLTSLGVIGALVKHDNSEITQFLINSDVIPMCLQIMGNSTELSKTVAIFILQKIINDKYGLEYVCALKERFMHIASTLKYMVHSLTTNASPRLLKHLVRAYLRLADNQGARRMLQTLLPEPLRDGTFSHVLKDDASTKHALASLLHHLSADPHMGLR